MTYLPYTPRPNPWTGVPYVGSLIDAIQGALQELGMGGGGGGGGGSVWYTGSGAPSSGLGVNGDFYLNSTNGDVYEKITGTWTLIMNITGPAGPAGVVGSVWRTGSGVPSNSLGVDGDYYLRTSNGDVYYKSGGVYAVVCNITGAAGAVWYNGSGVPSGGLGIDGDYYLRTSNGDVYYKATGSWSVVSNITGPTGATGATGAPGAVWRSGSGAPSNGLGIDGDWYVNTDNGDVYFKSGGTYSIVLNIHGSIWRVGSGVPSNSLGVNGDWYLNVDNGDIYYKAAGAYTLQSNLTPKASLSIIWQGDALPAALGPAGGVWRVPYINGVSKTYNMQRLVLRLEVPAPSTVSNPTTTVKVQYSAGGGAFSGTDIATLTAGAGVYEHVITTSLGTLTSGQLVRLYWTSIGVGPNVWTVHFEGRES